ncbi:hypothetical protein TEA_009576 [Camellia sinensis var. sinensis]|uniref:Uncharacterized protein n=1 Tax=Camellia sinensis var. sinensis TaxID=542762 RepID=A0A4S4DWX8_CAMSN|nr:hypothetical protein TEA_009576 [Camellia sinensis var. sinensis]
MAEDGFEVGFEEGMSWLPTHVACHFKEDLRSQRHQQNGGRLNLAAEPLLPPAKCSMRKPNHRARNPRNWGAGNGMQAVFLDSSSSAQTRSCGTGVFLPRKAGSPFHPTKKPGCSPVLLPSRVVQALNLNVHELGLQIKPPQGLKVGTRHPLLSSPFLQQEEITQGSLSLSLSLQVGESTSMAEDGLKLVLKKECPGFQHMWHAISSNKSVSMRKTKSRSRNPRNWGAGNGMQAVFLDSSSSAQTRSCGTGVFLPRKAGSPFHPTKAQELDQDWTDDNDDDDDDNQVWLSSIAKAGLHKKSSVNSNMELMNEMEKNRLLWEAYLAS